MTGCLGSENKPMANITNQTNADNKPVGNMDQFLVNNSQNGPLLTGSNDSNNPPVLLNPNDNQSEAQPVAKGSNGSTLVINSQNALKISMLRLGERLQFGRSQLRLEDIYYRGGPIAQYELLDQDDNAIEKLELGQNQTFRFSGPDKIDYVIRAVFVIGEGMPNGVQTQIYRASDLQRSPWAADIGKPLVSYLLKFDYPPPKLLENRTLGIGDTVQGGELVVQLQEIDRSEDAPVASLRIMDASHNELGQVSLLNGQMVEVRMPSGERYAVVLANLPREDQQADIAIYQTQVFRAKVLNNTDSS